MASTATAATYALASPSLGPEGRAAAAPHCVGLPPLHTAPNVASTNRLQARESRKSASHCRKIARNVAAMATGDAPAEVATELPEIVKTIQETIQDAWDKLEDKYAVTSIGVAGVLALWVSTGMISAIDRLPLVPSILELVGIGYTGWFAYRNLVFKPDRIKRSSSTKHAVFKPGSIFCCREQTHVLEPHNRSCSERKPQRMQHITKQNCTYDGASDKTDAQAESLKRLVYSIYLFNSRV